MIRPKVSRDRAGPQRGIAADLAKHYEEHELRTWLRGRRSTRRTRREYECAQLQLPFPLERHPK